MGILSMLESAETRASLENPSTSLANPDAWLFQALGAQRTWAGVSVSPQSAMRLAAVAACHRIIAEAVASLPYMLMERLQPRGKRRATDQPLYNILHDQANSEGMTAFGFRETMLHHLCGWGNAYAEKEMDKAGRVIGLWPLLPDRTRVERINGKKVITTRVKDQRQGEREVGLPPERVLHVMGLSYDGLTGYGYIRMHRQMLGAAMAAEEFAARFFGNGMHLGLVLEHPGELSTGAKERLRVDLEYLNGGLEQAHRLAIFEEGMKLNRAGIPPKEAQFIEQQKYSREQIAMIYRVPLHLLQVGGSDAGQGYASVEQKSLEFVLYTVRPWLVRIEQAVNAQLLTTEERKRFFSEHLADGLLRGDYKSRMDGHAVRRQWGLASYNDIAEIENWEFDETPAGDMRLVPLNMIPADMARDRPEKEKAAAEGEEKPPAAIEAPPPEQKALPAARFGVLLERRGQAHQPLFEQAQGWIIGLEIAALRRLLKASNDIAAFVPAAEKFYQEAWPRDCARLLSPSVYALAATLAKDVEEWSMSEVDLAQDAEAVARLHVERYAPAHAQWSMDRLRQEIAKAEDPLAAVGRVLDEWSSGARAKAQAREMSRGVPRVLASGLAAIVGVARAFLSTEPKEAA